MKVTKNILREIIEAEIKLLNEADGDVERTGLLGWRSPQKTLNALLKWLDKDDRIGDISADSSESDRNKKRKYKRKFEMIWSQIDGAIIQSDIEENATLSGILDRGIEKDWIDDDARTQMSAGQTASGIEAPIAEITVELPEDDDDEDASADESEQAQEGGETELSAESTAMLTAMAEEGKVLQRGSKSAKVGLLQDALRARLGNMSHQWLGALGDSDNDYGRKTKLAVEEVQKKYGLTPDGAAGPNTAASLLANEKADGAPVSRGSGSSSEEAASDEINLVWDEENRVHYSEQPHTANNDSGEPTEYNLWIRKGNKDYHANGTYAEVTPTEIEALSESKSIIERFNSYLNEIVFTTGSVVNDEPAEAGDDGEAVTGPVVTVTGGPEAGTEPEAVGEPSEDSINAATEALTSIRNRFKRSIGSLSRAIKLEGSSWFNVEEDKVMTDLESFDEKAEAYYEECSEHVAILSQAGRSLDGWKTPSEYLYNNLKDASSMDSADGRENQRDELVSWFDRFFARGQFAKMKRIIERNARPLTANSSEVMASGTTEQQETIDTINGNIRTLVTVIKTTAKTIGENSYNSAVQFGDEADEDAVMAALEAFEDSAQQFYEDVSQIIVDNNFNVLTPTLMLLAYYKRSVTSDDSAESVEGMILEMEEFLAFGNEDRMKDIINSNNVGYQAYVRGDISESLSYDRFQKLAGILLD